MKIQGIYQKTPPWVVPLLHPLTLNRVGTASLVGGGGGHLKKKHIGERHRHTTINTAAPGRGDHLESIKWLLIKNMARRDWDERSNTLYFTNRIKSKNIWVVFFFCLFQDENAIFECLIKGCLVFMFMFSGLSDSIGEKKKVTSCFMGVMWGQRNSPLRLQQKVGHR